MPRRSNSQALLQALRNKNQNGQDRVRKAELNTLGKIMESWLKRRRAAKKIIEAKQTHDARYRDIRKAFSMSAG